MTSPEMKKAPRPGGAIKNRSTNNDKEETMNPIQPHPADKRHPFDAVIHVAGLTVSPFFEHGTEVALSIEGDEPGNLLEFTPAEACALAAALQAVAVHLMEQTGERAA